jgi:hypothetical protein
MRAYSGKSLLTQHVGAFLFVMKHPEELFDNATRPEVGPHLGGAVMSTVNVEALAEQATGQLSPEFIAEREHFFVRQEAPVWGACGDDRPATEQSVAELTAIAPEVTPANEAYASVFGGAAGMAKNVMLAGIIKHGPQFVAEVGGFDGLYEMIVQKLTVDESDQAVYPLLHSAAGNENEDGSFCTHGEAATGCAYCGGVGATSALLTDEASSLIRDVARDDQISTFGDDQYVDQLLAAHTTFLESGTSGQGGAFTVDRQTYIAQVQKNRPVMILAGSHAGAKGSGVIANFEVGTVGSAGRASKAGMDFYRLDIAQVTAALQRNLRELELDSEVLMRAFLLDATPVRAVLAAHDADPDLHDNLDPRNLGAGFRGDPQAAIAQLTTIA